MNFESERVVRWLWRDRRLRPIACRVIPNMKTQHLPMIRDGFCSINDKGRTVVEPIVNRPAKEKLNAINGWFGVGNFDVDPAGFHLDDDRGHFVGRV